MVNLTECRKIYDEAFCDNSEFTDNLFRLCGKFCRSLVIDGKTVSMLFLMPCIIVSGEKRYESAYIYAAATDKAYRGMGYMKSLLDKIQNEYRRVLFLKPANDELIELYTHCGFRKFTATKAENEFKFAVPCEEFSEISEYCRYENAEYTAMCGFETQPDLNGLSFPYTME